jgi:hypothetical protein
MIAALESIGLSHTSVCLSPLTGRAIELARLIAEYARDAVTDLSAQDTGFTDADRTRVHERAATSLAEIEKTTLRLVGIHTSGSTSAAAAPPLGMVPVSLLRWIGCQGCRRCFQRRDRAKRGVRGIDVRGGPASPEYWRRDGPSNMEPGIRAHLLPSGAT